MLKKYASVDSGSKFININGRNIHYRIDGKGPVLLMFPGTLDTLQTYDAIVPLLKDKFTLVRMDIPGFGFSESLDWDQNWVHQIHLNIHQFMQTLGLPKYSILGNSLGGLMAWTHALEYPENIEKIILLDPAAYHQDIPWFLDVTNPVIKRTRGVIGIVPLESSLNLIAKWSHGVLGPVEDEKFVKYQIQRMSEIFQTEVNVTSYMNFLDLFVQYDFEHSKYIKDLPVDNVLLVFGAEDTVVKADEQIKQWKADLPNIQLYLRENGGHVPHWEYPHDLATIIETFMNNQ